MFKCFFKSEYVFEDLILKFRLITAFPQIISDWFSLVNIFTSYRKQQITIWTEGRGYMPMLQEKSAEVIHKTLLDTLPKDIYYPPYKLCPLDRLAQPFFQIWFSSQEIQYSLLLKKYVIAQFFTS